MRSLYAVALLLVLAPVSAEYLLGYDSSTGNPVRLAAGLLIFIPLYGAPAVLIRELTRLLGRGWPTMLCWCAAWAVLQAGLVDQSVFNPDYRGIEYWEQLWAPTAVAGLSIFAALTFVLGHVIFSLGAPIALVESVFPDVAEQPWLRPWAISVLLLLGVSALALVAYDTQQREQFHVSPGQLTACVALIVLLIALPLSRRGPLPRSPTRKEQPFMSHPLVVGAVAFVAALVLMIFAPPTWFGVALWLFLVTGMAFLVRRDALRNSGQQHILALGAGALLAISVGGVLIGPIGDVPVLRVIAHHTVLSLLVLGLAMTGWRRSDRFRLPRGD